MLALALADAGFDFSVLCEFRTRLLQHGATERLLGRLLDAAREGSSKVYAFVTVVNTLQWIASGRPGANRPSTWLFSLLHGRGEWPPL